MIDLGFYHLTRNSIEEALPRLLSRTLSAGERAHIVCSSEEIVARLDGWLWECPELWLPHGSSLASGQSDALQPIWIDLGGQPPNAANYLFSIGGADLPATGYKRIFDLFDGQDEEAVSGARRRWSDAKKNGLTPVYWRQSAAGWEKAA